MPSNEGQKITILSVLEISNHDIRNSCSAFKKGLERNSFSQ